MDAADQVPHYLGKYELRELLGRGALGETWRAFDILFRRDVAIDVNRVAIQEKNGRVFYPAVTQGVFGRLIGQILGSPTDRIGKRPAERERPER